jgi:hypothetical protein
MRHRKVLNLYDTDPSHEDLLIYLESIEGSTRQSQAMLQMLLIGYRVVTMQESGEEAYHAVRNPDFAKALKKRLVTRTHVQRISPKQVVEKEEAHLHDEPIKEVAEVPLVSKPITNESLIEVVGTYIEPEDNNVDEYNTLQILRAADRG